MTSRILWRLLAVVPAVVVALAAPAAAQTAAPSPAGYGWSRGTTLNVFAGGASASSTAGPLAGAAVGWEISPWWGLEASGAWLDRGEGASAFTASIGANVNLTRPRLAVPFVGGGVGLYRASFESASGRPPFYADRPGPAAQTFTDPALRAGGGVTLYATPHWSIRPQADAILVRRDGRQHVLTALTVHLGYHFERHPIPPSRRHGAGTN